MRFSKKLGLNCFCNDFFQDLTQHDTCWMPLTENPHCAEVCNSVSTTMTSKDLGQGWSFRGGVCMKPWAQAPAHMNQA